MKSRGETGDSREPPLPFPRFTRGFSFGFPFGFLAFLLGCSFGFTLYGFPKSRLLLLLTQFVLLGLLVLFDHGINEFLQRLNADAVGFGGGFVTSRENSLC